MDNIRNRGNGNMFLSRQAQSDSLPGSDSVPLGRKKNMRSYCVLAVVVACVVVGYAGLVEPNRLVVRRVVIHDSVLARAWSGLTIVHLSDTHIVRMGKRESMILRVVNELSPDLIVASGDFMQWRADPKAAQQFLAQLSAPLGVYGVLGDSDQVVNTPKGCAFCHPDGRYHERLANPVIMQNEVKRIETSRGVIVIAGVDFKEEGSDKWLQQLQAKAWLDHEPLLIVSHRSEGWLDTPFAVHSLWLSGDTHGGQVWMPDWVWRMIPYKPDPQHMGGTYANEQGGWLVVSRGVGVTARFPFRLGVPPEVVVITFAEGEGDLGR